MAAIEEKIKCPLIAVPKVTLCDTSQLNPLCDYIVDNNPWTQVKTFERGTISSPGRLDLCKQGIGVEGTEKLIGALKKNDHIKHLLLGTDSLGDEGAGSLAQHLSDNSTIETVYLGCNLISQSGAAELSQALENNTSVKSLWLKRNPLGNDGVRAIAKMLRVNTNLRTLDLVNTGLDHVGVSLLADALKHGKASLQAMYLGGNQLDENSIESLISILATSNLEALFLNVNQLGDKFIGALANNAHKLKPDLVLGLASNSFTSAGLEILFEAGVTLQFKNLDLSYARSTKALGASANFFGDLYGEQWNLWLQKQASLQCLYLNKTGVGHKTLCRIIDTVKSHAKLHTLSLSKSKSPNLREALKQSLQSKKQLIDSSKTDNYLNDIAQIKSVYR